MIGIAREVCEMAKNKYEIRNNEIAEFNEALQFSRNKTQATEIE